MQIRSIKLTDYRNYARAEILPCPGITVLHGLNAQGKTAVLEAVYLACTGRSHRTSRDHELIRYDAPAAHIAIDCMRRDGSHQVDIVIPDTGRKQIRINGNRIARSGELLGHVTGVLFSPEDLRMVKDGPQERRRFMDMELSQIQPSYYYALQRYHRALAQRGQLLRDIRSGQAKTDTLDIWDEQLALSGARIIEARRAFVQQLLGYASAIHTGISDNREHLTLTYQSTLVNELSGDALQQALLKKLAKAREADLKRGITSVGPHRDDMGIFLDGVDARVYASQGQQRSCALSIKLSELSLMREATGEYPILMLDDVMSELDAPRRRCLLAQLQDVQTILTCTELRDIADAPVGLALGIENGRVLTANP